MEKAAAKAVLVRADAKSSIIQLLEADFPVIASEFDDYLYEKPAL